MRARRWIFGLVFGTLVLSVGMQEGWSAPRDGDAP